MAPEIVRVDQVWGWCEPRKNHLYLKQLVGKKDFMTDGEDKTPLLKVEGTEQPPELL